MTVPTSLAAHSQQLIELVKSWKVNDVNLDIGEERLDITLEWPRVQKAPCLKCGKRRGLKDRFPVRRWGHLDSMQIRRFIHCHILRSDCCSHRVLANTVHWATASAQWNLLFDAFTVLVLEHVASLSRGETLLGASWKEDNALRKHAVARGLARRSVDQSKYVCIDEKSFGKKGRFITVQTDLTGEWVLDVARSNSSAAAKAVLTVVPEAEREGVQAVPMDMSAAMEKACREELRAADIVYDKFHIEKHLSDAMGKVRRPNIRNSCRKGLLHSNGRATSSYSARKAGARSYRRRYVL